MERLRISQIAKYDGSPLTGQSETRDCLQRMRCPSEEPCTSTDIQENTDMLVHAASDLLQRPLEETLTPKSRKKGASRDGIFDIHEDEEEAETLRLSTNQYSDQTTTSTMVNDTQLTAINQRQSIKLGSNILGKRALNVPSTDEFSHDGPLLSKKLKPSATAHPLKHSQSVSPYDSPSRRVAMQPRRVYGGAKTRTRQTGTKSADGQHRDSLSTNVRRPTSMTRAEDSSKVQMPKISADLTDSIRTAYDSQEERVVT